MRLLTEFFRIALRLLAVCGALALALAVLLMDFMARADVRSTPDLLPRTAIVFTGQPDRIHKGLDLLTDGKVDRLFITGANRSSGVNVARFGVQFGLSPEQFTWLETGKIILAEDASNTFENAWEADCWLRQQGGIDAVILITERRHMPRASIALRNAIKPIRVERVYSDALADYDPLQIDLRSFGAYIATWGITLLPYSFWPAEEPTICQSVPHRRRRWIYQFSSDP